MYPAPFTYVQAGSWTEAAELLGRHGDEAKVIAGGQSLVPMMSLRLAKPTHLVDVGGADRPGIRWSDGMLQISALTRHADVEQSPEVASACPLLQEAAGSIGNIRVRHRGTMGGSLAHADPAAEYPCVAVATGAVIRTLRTEGERHHPADAFFVTYLTTLLDPDEVITSVEFPTLGDRSGSSFVELARRAGDFAIVEVAAIVHLAPDADTCADVRLVLGGISDRPVDLSAAARGALVGQQVEESAIVDAARAVSSAARPRDDDRASASYRVSLINALAGRALRRAAQRARTDPQG